MRPWTVYTGTVINRTATVPQGRATVVNKAKREQHFVNKPDSWMDIASDLWCSLPPVQILLTTNVFFLLFFLPRTLRGTTYGHLPRPAEEISEFKLIKLRLWIDLGDIIWICGLFGFFSGFFLDIVLDICFHFYYIKKWIFFIFLSRKKS